MTKREFVLEGCLALSAIALFYSAVSFIRSVTSESRPRLVSRSEPVQVAPNSENVADPSHAAGRELRPRLPHRSICQAPANEGATLQSTSSDVDTDEVEEGEASIPLALVDPPANLVSTEEQVNEFVILREEFVEMLGGPGHDPASPEYRQRWDEAQRRLDDQFASFFGVEAFDKQQIKAAHQSGQPSGAL